MTVLMAATAAVLFGTGTYLLLQRQLSRIIIGLGLLAHGANLIVLLAASGPAAPTFIGSASEDTMLDPLPQAFVLTAIVISFGVTSFLLALAYRSYVLSSDDLVPDDLEDRAIARRERRSEYVEDAEAAEADSDARSDR